MDKTMKNETRKLTDEELTEICFGIANVSIELKKDNQRRKQLAKTDKTYLYYPCILIETEEIVGYPYEGWSKEEIEETVNNF